MRYSIVIPVYGTEGFLHRCLDSLVTQTDGDFEVIVVDDASSGACSEIVSGYDERFRCIRHETNRSAFQARCTGIRVAKGDYIVPVDPDDYLLPETLARLAEVIDRDASDLISYLMEYDDGRKTFPHWCRHPQATMTGREALRELTEHKYFTGVASKAFRRGTMLQALRDLNAPADLYVNTSDDFLMLVPSLIRSARVTFLDYAGYRYFVNEQSTSFSWRNPEGFRRACRQTHCVGELVMRVAAREDVAAEVRSLVATAVAGIERWFVQMTIEQRSSDWKQYMPILLAELSASNVAAEALSQLSVLRDSRTYRTARFISGLMRRR